MMSDRTRRRTGRAAVLILALLLCEPVLWGLGRPPAPAGARSLPPGIDGTDHRVALDSAAWPWAAIGRVNRAVGGFCTGTLVAPRAVLTAAHCLYDARRRHWIAAGDLHFLAGYRRGAWLAHGVAKAVVLPPAYRPEAPLTPASLAEDWAVLVLAEPLAISPVPVRALPGPASVPDGTSL